MTPPSTVPMPVAEPRPQSAPTRAAPTRSAERAVEALVDAAASATSELELFKAALPILARSVNATYAEIEVRRATTVANDTYTDGSSDPEFWTATAQSLLTKSLTEGRARARMFRSTDASMHVALLSTPFRAPGGSCEGALVAVAPYAESEEVRDLLGTMSLAVSVLISLVPTVGESAPRDDGEMARESSNLRKVAQYGSPTELAFAIVNKLRTREGCQQVSFATVRASKVRLLAISGLDQVHPRAPGTQLIQAAVEECADLGRRVVEQPDSLEGVAAGRLHRQWRAAAGGCVASIPLRVDGECVAVLAVQRAPDAPFGAADLDELEGLVAPYVSGIAILEGAHRSLAAHLAEATRHGLNVLWRSGTRARRLVLAVAAAAFLWCAFGSIDETVTVDAVLLPSERRTVGAPFDGVIAEAFVAPGMQVRAGDVLCTFDMREIELEIERLESELHVARIEGRRALAEGSPMDRDLASAKEGQIRAQLALQRMRSSQASLRAPVDGVLLVGDLRARVGDVVSKGTSLFEIGASDGWRVELRVPEAKVLDVRSGLEGSFVSNSRPEDELPLEVQRINPGADNLEGTNVFIAEGRAAGSPGWAKSGMEGSARLVVGSRSPLGVLFRRIRDVVRETLR